MFAPPSITEASNTTVKEILSWWVALSLVRALILCDNKNLRLKMIVDLIVLSQLAPWKRSAHDFVI